MTPVRLVLELDWDAGRVAGVVVAESGERVSFSGWLALAAALERLAAASA